MMRNGSRREARLACVACFAASAGALSGCAWWSSEDDRGPTSHRALPADGGSDTHYDAGSRDAGTDEGDHGGDDGYVPLDVPGWTHVIVGPDGVYPTEALDDRVWVFDVVTPPATWSCTCPSSYTTDESWFASATPFASATCDSDALLPISGDSCTPLYPSDGSTTGFGALFPRQFQGARVSAPTSLATSTGGYAANGEGLGPDIYRESSVDVWIPFMDDLPAGFENCQLASGDLACPAGYPDRRVMYGFDDARDCECATTVVQASPSFAFYDDDSCAGAVTGTVPATDGSCDRVTVPDSANSVRIETTATVTIATAPTYSGQVTLIPSTVCCPAN